MKVTQTTIELIKTFEGFRATTYKDSAGHLTIGYGTTGMAGVHNRVWDNRHGWCWH